MTRRIGRTEAAFSAISLLLGIGLISAPWFFGFANVETASRNAWAGGAIIIVTAAMTLVSFAERVTWVEFLAGLWIAGSPWSLSFYLLISDTALRVQVALGLVIAVLAALELWIARRASSRITA
jgi:hypothetical protein